MFFKRKNKKNDGVLWIDEIYGINKSRLKIIKKKQKENLFKLEKISNESKLDISTDIIQFKELKELEVYFNTNVLGTYLLLEEIKKDEDNRRFAYNADWIFLNTQCLWDYILQYMNTYFSLELVETRAELELIKEKKVEITEFLKESDGDVKDIGMRELEVFISKQFKAVKLNNVVNVLEDKYEILGILEHVIMKLKQRNVELSNYRNKIAHHKSTYSTINKSRDWINGDVLATFNTNITVNKDEILKIIREELSRIKEVLNSLYTIEICGLYPNEKAHANKLYKVLNIKCKQCKTKMYMPINDEFQRDNQGVIEFIKKFIKCRECSLEEFEIGEIEQSTERGYYKILADFVMSTFD